MKHALTYLLSSPGRKVIMALTGLALAAFVFVHLAGNLQIFISKDALNVYGHHLHSLPWPVLWGFRLGLAGVALVHIITAVSLTWENLRARPKPYAVERSLQASFASKTMPVTGTLLLIFIVLHLLNFTLRIVPENYNHTIPHTTVAIHGETVETFDIYAMLLDGFSVPWISAFYIITMGMLCLHLSHGCSSLFQSLGLRNEYWRGVLDKLAMVYGWFLFVGFSIIPLAVLFGLLK